MRLDGIGRGNEADLSWLSERPAQEIAAVCFADPVLFCRYFLPHLFPTPMPAVHRAVLAILLRRTSFLPHYGELEWIFRNFVARDGTPIFCWVDGQIGLRLGQFTILLLPRGMSKTTIAAQAVPLFEILYELARFTFYISESATHARMQASNVRRELAPSPSSRIFQVFGDLKPKITDEQKWSEAFFETMTGMAVGTQGRGGQVRGANHRGQRPNKILIDDVEDKESVREADQRKKTQDWYMADVLPALPQVGELGTITLLGTMLHAGALLPTLAKSPRYTTIELGAMDRDGRPVWPQYMTKEKYEATKHDYALNGQLDLFHMEYDNKVVHNEHSLFQQRYFQFNSVVPPRSELRVGIYCDPAISEKRRADEAVITAVGMHISGKIFVLEEWAKIGASPRDIVNEIFAMRARWGKPRATGVESNAYQAALIHLLREEMFRKHDYFEPQAITHKTQKESRIAGVLQPRYAGGYIVHVREFPELQAQLLEFPHSSRMDRMDALAGGIALLDPYAAEAAGDKDLAADEYAESLEEQVGGIWQVI